MISPFGAMYLRPGNLWKNFEIRSLHTGIKNGHPEDKYIETGESILGILADADSNLADRMKHRWDQDQHSLTHTLVTRRQTNLKKGDFLILEGRAFLILLVDDIGSLGASGLVYMEERKDLK